VFNGARSQEQISFPANTRPKGPQATTWVLTRSQGLSMRVSSFADFEPEFIEGVRRMVWCDMATVGPGGRPPHRPSSVGVGPKACDVDRNPFV
jgi:hypothetical protein